MLQSARGNATSTWAGLLPCFLKLLFEDTKHLMAKPISTASIPSASQEMLPAPRLGCINVLFLGLHREPDPGTDLTTACPSPCPFHFFGQLGQLQLWGWTVGNRSSQYLREVLCVIQPWPKALSAGGRSNHSDQPSAACTSTKNNIYLPPTSCTSYVSPLRSSEQL